MNTGAADDASGDDETGSAAGSGSSFGLMFSGANMDFVGGRAGAVDPVLGTEVGGVFIESRVGCGGMGNVYVGRHVRLNCRVAVKVMRPEVASARALKRFEFEAQVLATLDHPGIVRVMHTDTATIDGVAQPYIVMDFVADALRLNDYATTREGSEREWMVLFRKVCEAVAAAHAKGVVHRDLKPGNILVTPDRQPHVIDFGVALVRDPDLAEWQPTQDGFAGTPRYMSPEQARGELDRIDVTSDVYSLGVVMYEALSGQMPYVIKAQTDAATVISNTSPMPLAVAQPGASRDVCTIVMKCLDKEQRGRYSTAAELAADIGRFLDDEAILAAPPTAFDTLRRFCRRHQMLAGAAASILVTLVASLGVVTGFYLRAERRREEMQVALGEARGERETTDLLVANVVRALGGARPRDAVEAEAMRGRLEETARGVSEGFGRGTTSRSDAVQARLLCAIGDVLMELGQPFAAREQFRAAAELLDHSVVQDDAPARDAGPTQDDELVPRCLGGLAHTALECGDYREAIDAGERAAALRRRRESGADPYLAGLHSSMAMARMSLGEIDQAAADYEEILANLPPWLGEPERAALLTNHGEILRRSGDLEAAEARHREAIAIWDRQPEHADAREGTALHNLGEVLRRSGRPTEAEDCHRRALELHRALLPPGHFLVSTGLSKLGEVRREAKRLDDAERLFLEALAIRQAAGLGDHPESALLLWRLALVHAAAGREEAARGCAVACLAIRTARLGADHPDTLEARAMFADTEKPSKEGGRP